MKFIIIFPCLFALAFTQGRPSYAGTLQKGIPELGSRFKDTESSSSSSSTNNVANRVDVDDLSTTARLPPVNIGDRVNSWPRENQPFWHLNSDAINQHLRPGNRNNQIGRQPFQTGNVNQRSSASIDSTTPEQQQISSRNSYNNDNIRQLRSSYRNYY